MENPVVPITQCLLLSSVLSSINQSISCRLARQKEITVERRQYIKMITLVSCIHVLQCCIIIREVKLLFLALSRHVFNKEFFFHLSDYRARNSNVRSCFVLFVFLQNPETETSWSYTIIDGLWRSGGLSSLQFCGIPTTFKFPSQDCLFATVNQSLLSL